MSLSRRPWITQPPLPRLPALLHLLICVTSVACLHPTPTYAQDATRPPITDLLTALQNKYDSVRDFSADFEHTYAGGVLRTKLVERGTVLIKKPGMMRWSYTEPEEKLFVSDGATLYSYIPTDRQVFVGQVPPDDRASTPVLFLAGQGDLSLDFRAAYGEAPDAPPNTWIIRLTPKQSTVDYEWLTLAVDRAGLGIMQLIAADFQGAVSTFTFTNLRENENLSDQLFTFQVPSGTEVITEDSFNR